MIAGDLTSYEERLLEAAAAAEQAAEGAATNKEAEVSGMEVDTAAAEEAADESMAEANEPNTGDAEGALRNAHVLVCLDKVLQVS